MARHRLELLALDDRLAVCRLDRDDPIPGWATQGGFSSITRTADELSVVCPEPLVPEGVRAERGWRVLQVAGAMDFSSVGVLASLAAPLAEAGVSLFAVSTFDTDYLLVREHDLGRAVGALTAPDRITGATAVKCQECTTNPARGYADHPTDPEIRQERYFLEVVVPFIEGRYPARAGREGRFLLGFSKSGWGAFSLLLRHPDRFGKAAAWDAPLMMDRPGRYGSGDIFGTRENFDQYRITKLLERRAADLRGPKRLILLGYGNFREQHEQAHAVMRDLEVPHDYRDGPRREHVWESGWVPEAVRLLLDAEGEDG